MQIRRERDRSAFSRAWEEQERAKSDQLKEKICKKCKERLEHSMTREQLEVFERTFYDITRGFLFSDKKKGHD